MKRKLLSLLVLLMTAATGAWAQNSHWQVPSGIYQEYKTLFAGITIDGVTITTDYGDWDHLEVAAFDDNGECRSDGNYLTDKYVERFGHPFPILDGMKIYYNSAGETVTFKLYNHALSEECATCTVTLNGDEIIIHTGEDHKEYREDCNNPVFLNFITPAPTVVDSGDCGTGVTWTLTSDGVLTISGTGAMADYSIPGDSNPAPWLSSHMYDITSVVIEDGVTNIGNSAFFGCEYLASVTIPASVTSIGNFAFEDCDNLETVIIPASVTSIGDYAFYSCDDLETVTVYADPSCTLGHDAFAGCSNLTAIYVFSDKVDDFESALGWSDYVILEIPSTSVTVSGVTARQNPDIETDYWCTYYHPQANVKINTTGVQIFKASLSEDNLTLTAVYGDVIKAGQAVVLKATADDALDMELTSSAPSGDFSGNELKGTSVAMTGAAGNIYVLNAKSGTGAGFYKLKASGTLGANKAYLTYSGSGGGAGAREFFGFGKETTSISEELRVKSEEFATAPVYDLQGRRVASSMFNVQSSMLKKGLYIVNGKKVVIK